MYCTYSTSCDITTLIKHRKFYLGRNMFIAFNMRVQRKFWTAFSIKSFKTVAKMCCFTD